MKATELRIGNIIQVKDVYSHDWISVSIKNFDETGINFNRLSGLYDYIFEYIKPVLLKGNWFLRCNLTREKNVIGLTDDYSVCLELIDDNVFLTVDNKRIKIIEYVHQLQNIYFAFKDQEFEFHLNGTL